MITKLKLGTKFTLLLSVVFMGGIIVSGFVLWEVLQRSAQAEITSQGVMLIETMVSVRSYTSDHIKPLLPVDFETEAEFIQETVPASAAREVFEIFQQNEQQAAFSYKEATLNPTNLNNKADSFEEGLVDQMRSNRSIDEISDFRTLRGEQVFFIARPLAVTAVSCLACHSEPESAPASLLATYGSENGFGWQLDEIIAAQIIYVPAEEVFDKARRSFTLVMGIFVGIMAIVIFLLNFLLKRYVIHPVSVLGTLAKIISADQLVPEHLDSESVSRITTRADELGQLAQVFRRMTREVYARVQSLKQQVDELRIEIDVIKRQKQVKEIVESDIFQDIQDKARKMRKRHGDEDDDTSEVS